MQNISAAVTTATLTATTRPIMTASGAPAWDRVIEYGLKDVSGYT